MSDLAIVILAAGASRRFGSAKQLALVDGKPLITHSVDAALAVTDADSYVVLGANYSAIKSVIELSTPSGSSTLRILHNRQWQEGISTSIGLAIEKLATTYDALLFLAADQVEITAEDLNKLISEWQQRPQKIIAAEYNDTLGIPAIFPRRYAAELQALSGDKGAKSVILGHGGDTVAVSLPRAARDIDRVSDL